MAWVINANFQYIGENGARFNLYDELNSIDGYKPVYDRSGCMIVPDYVCDLIKVYLSNDGFSGLNLRQYLAKSLGD